MVFRFLFQLSGNPLLANSGFPTFAVYHVYTYQLKSASGGVVLVIASGGDVAGPSADQPSCSFGTQGGTGPLGPEVFNLPPASAEGILRFFVFGTTGGYRIFMRVVFTVSDAAVVRPFAEGDWSTGAESEGLAAHRESTVRRRLVPHSSRSAFRSKEVN